MYTYDLILGMGMSCPCSQALRAAGLLLLSFPFDWVRCPAFPEQARQVADGFRNWLVPGTLTPVATANVTLPTVGTILGTRSYAKGIV